MGSKQGDWQQLLAVLPLPALVFDVATQCVVGVSQRLSMLTGRGVGQYVGESLSSLGLSGLLSSKAGVVLRDTAGRVVAQSVQAVDWPASGWKVVTWTEDAGIAAELTELRQSDRRLQALLDNATAVIFAKDLDGRFLFVNRRFEELFGFTRQQTLGRRTTDLFPADHAVTYEENDARALLVQGTLEVEEQAWQPDGMHTYLSLKFALRDESGRPYALCGISTDITARKQMEANLRESEERFRQLAENLHECVWVRDVESGRLLYVNPAFEQIWGRPVESLYRSPKEWLEAIHSADRAMVLRGLSEQMERGDFEEEYRIIRPDGQIRWVHDRGVAIRNDAGEVYRIAGIAEDITQRRILEHAVSEASRREQERISRELHDGVGQQLTGLAYLAGSLAKRLDGSDAEAAISIRDGLKEALSEVRQIVRGLTPVGLEVEELPAALERLAQSVYNRYGTECSFVHVGEAQIDDPAVAIHLYRIAQEAVNNAVRHGEPSRIEIRLESTVGALTLIVNDDGRGMRDEERDSGLGLKIMRYRSGIIGAMFEVVSKPSGGTSVIIRRQKDNTCDHEGGKTAPGDAGR